MKLSTKPKAESGKRKSGNRLRAILFSLFAFPLSAFAGPDPTNAVVVAPLGLDLGGAFDVPGSALVGAIPLAAENPLVITNFGGAGSVGQQSTAGIENWGALQSPPVFLYFAPYPAHVAGVPTDTEFTITNYLAYLLRSNYVAAITNYGHALYFYVDVGWDARRNFDPGFWMTNRGTLMWDTNMFPDGIPWLAQKLATNGIHLALGLYANGGSYYKIPAGASGWTINISGNFPLAYTNGVGTGLIYTNAGYKVAELSGPDTVQNDVDQIHWWGASALLENDIGGNPPDEVFTRERLTADAIMKTWLPPGFNQNNGTSYYSQNLAAINWGATNSWTATNQPAVFATWNQFPWNYFAASPLINLPFETLNGNQAQAFGDLTRKFNNGFMYDNFVAPIDGRSFTNWSLNFPGCRRMDEGGYFIGNQETEWQGDITIVNLASAIECVAGAYDPKAICVAMQTLTNAALCAINLDPLQSPATLVTNFGIGVGTCYKKPLANGDLALAFFDEATTDGWRPAVTWSQLGLNTNDWYSISFIWDYGRQRYWLPATNKIGISTNFAMNAHAQILVRLSKLPDAGQLYGPGNFTGSAQGLTNFNAASMPGNLPAWLAVAPAVIAANVVDFGQALNTSAGGSFVGARVDQFFQGSHNDGNLYAFALNNNSAAVFPAFPCYGKVTGTNLVSIVECLSTGAVSGTWLPRFHFYMGDTNLDCRFEISGTGTNYFSTPAGTNHGWLIFTNCLNPYSTARSLGGFACSSPALTAPFSFTNAALTTVGSFRDCTITNGPIYILSYRQIYQ